MPDAPIDAHLPPPGTLLADRYRIERVIGVGGMGHVLLARHEALGKQVALKLLNRSAAKDRDAVERFFNEARAAGTIEGDNVVRIIDVGRLSDGQPFRRSHGASGVRSGGRRRRRDSAARHVDRRRCSARGSARSR